MNFGFNFGLLGKGSGGGLANTCFTTGTDGTWTGYDSSVPYGTATPAMSNTGQLFYAFRYKATGEIEMKFGAAGNEQLPDTSVVEIVDKDGRGFVALHWNATTLLYEATDTDMTDILMPLADFCIGVYALPDLFIHYDFQMETL